ncbi:MAG: hypothetical protein ABH823_01305 [bacterium]
MYAEVLLSRTTRTLDKIFHYSIPEQLKNTLRIGHQVVVPFGRRQDVGFVVGFVEQAEVVKTRDIIKLGNPEPLFTEQQVELAKWIADYYCSFLSSALKLMLPPGGKR